MSDAKYDVEAIEVSQQKHDVPDVQGLTHDQTQAATGTVHLMKGDGDGRKDVVLIPAPTQDPRDPLNMPTWRKWTFAVILSVYSCTGLTVVSAAGALISFFLQDYIEAGKGYQDIVNLITVPTLSMGLSNFLFTPIALGIGRRPIFLFSCALLFISCIIAANNNSYEYHLGIRIVIGFAAGQSEALVPLMLKEAFFLHERANILTFQAAFQTTVGCILSLFSSQIAAAVGWKNWYYVYAGISGVVLVMAIIFGFETKYERPIEAYNGIGVLASNASPEPAYDEKASDEGIETSSTSGVRTGQVTSSNRPPIDYNNYKARTIWSDLNPMPAKVEWSETRTAIKHIIQMAWFPNMVLIIVCNSIFLGINIAMGTTYATALEAPPYNWLPKNVGFAQCGQIVVAFLCLPALGFGSDRLAKRMAARRGGQHEPEVRLIPLAIPIIFGIISCVLFGYAYDHPTKVHWFAIVFSYAGQYFSFIAASVAGQTYLLDAYPLRAGAVLVSVCACRGIISFGLVYSLTPTQIALGGHLGQYGMYAGITTGLGFGCLALYFFGRRLRLWTLKFVVDKGDLKTRFG